MSTPETLTRQVLSDQVHAVLGLARKDAGKLVEDVFAVIAEALLQGEQVKILGFGTFNLRDKQKRVGRNPKTGEEAVITPRRVVTFKPSQILKEKISPSKPTSKTKKAA